MADQDGRKRTREENNAIKRSERAADAERKENTRTINKLLRARLTPAQQLARLDFRLGTGVGAAKERARLKKQIEAANTKTKPKEDTQEPQQPKGKKGK